MEEILIETLKIVAMIVAPVIAAMVVQLLRKTLKKIGLELEAEQEAKTEYLVKQAVLRAEEWGASRIKAKVITSAQDKLEFAMKDLVARAGLSAEEAANRIHSVLPAIRLGSSFSSSASPTAPAPESKK